MLRLDTQQPSRFAKGHFNAQLVYQHKEKLTNHMDRYALYCLHSKTYNLLDNNCEATYYLIN